VYVTDKGGKQHGLSVIVCPTRIGCHASYITRLQRFHFVKLRWKSRDYVLTTTLKMVACLPATSERDAHSLVWHFSQWQRQQNNLILWKRFIPFSLGVEYLLATAINDHTNNQERVYLGLTRLGEAIATLRPYHAPNTQLHVYV